MKKVSPLKAFAGLMLFASILQSRAGDQIQVYTVPKEHPAMQTGQSQMTAGAQNIPVNAASVHWATLPAGWTEKPPDGFRLASIAIAGENGGKAEVAITSFPGSVGTELDNVNRWRNELSLAPITPGEIKSEPVTVDSSQGKLYDIVGASGRTVVANIPRNGSAWFIKLRGDINTVAAARPAFLEFLKSVRFGDGGGIGDPHGEIARQAVSESRAPATTTEGSAGEPKWSIPSQWVESQPGPMIFKSFSVSGDDGGKANVTVSFFSGSVGGVLANVNRWRGQMGQPPVETDQLVGITEPLSTLAGKATMVDITGTDGNTGQPGRLIAVIVPNGDKTWFYKLMGNDKVVGGQKNTFVEFVKTVQYP